MFTYKEAEKHLEVSCPPPHLDKQSYRRDRLNSLKYDASNLKVSNQSTTRLKPRLNSLLTKKERKDFCSFVKPEDLTVKLC